MKFQNNLTGDEIELPRPDRLGKGVVLFNGRVVERVTYCDAENSVTTESGRVFHSDTDVAGDAFADYLIEQLRTGAYHGRPN